MKKSRAPDLTQEVLQQVLDTLDGWTGKLTWDLLLEAVHRLTGHWYSRFTFADYPEIANAFSFRKESLRGAVPRTRGEPKDERLRAALKQIERLQARADRLQVENDLLVEQFVTWAINAERKGVTLDMLNATLPKPERDHSKGVK
ncbi:hypothetical protein KIH07_06175 [Hydrogenophaga taeniospiralis]|uniref:hypothetical protein n=1 Tax=Hydrogenophaga taeniospiralis TaxID=65656 RepID=UPI001CFBEED3|nr:hypothetical protein [Hydrogenophaga taeniospiralis]MCB4363314.1 hypothetical protein [Hydrogenophaga taeniospiralis]